MIVVSCCVAFAYVCVLLLLYIHLFLVNGSTRANALIFAKSDETLNDLITLAGKGGKYHYVFWARQGSLCGQ